MRLTKLRIQNFRCYKDREVSFNDYNCLVGPGGVGKSTILNALRVLFRDSSGSPTDLIDLQAEDFHNRDTSTNISITATFSDLEPGAQEAFKHYYRQGQLVVSAVARWDKEAKSAEVRQYGQRMVMRPFAGFFEAESSGSSVAELKEIYSTIRRSFTELPAAGTKAAMKESLTEYEANHLDQCELHPSEDEFYGFTKGANRLREYIEWVFVPAVKDASTEQLEAKKTAIGLLLERTVRNKMSFSQLLAELREDVEQRYSALLSANQAALAQLSETLNARLQEWADPNARLALSWHDDPGHYVSISEPMAEVLAGDARFQGTVARLGHGLQRSFLLALLQELSGCRDTGLPKLLLACEEPELYQHPPQARHLAGVLQKLSMTNTQVMISTHSPYFISGRGFEDVRLFRHELGEDEPTIRGTTFADLSAKLAEALGKAPTQPTGIEFLVEQGLQAGLNEMFFCSVLILVEGLEDVGYISAYLTLTHRMDEFRRLGCHIVSTSGKSSMIQPLAIARLLDIPTFVVFDSDGDYDADKPGQKEQHERDNLALLRLCSVSNPNPFPATVFQTHNLLAWPTNLGKAIREDIGLDNWNRYEKNARMKRGVVGVPSLDKNMLFIGAVLAEAQQDGRPSPVLDGLCNQIIAYAHQVKPTPSRAMRPRPAEGLVGTDSVK
jgi:putative ATP-dependent endonuclease of OLD family